MQKHEPKMWQQLAVLVRDLPPVLADAVRKAAGLEKKVPVLSPGRWMEFRGVGRAALPRLEKLGLVADETPEHPDLSVRARNVLKRQGVAPTRTAVLEALESGRIAPGLRGCGRKTLNELRLAVSWAIR